MSDDRTRAHDPDREDVGDEARRTLAGPEARGGRASGPGGEDALRSVARDALDQATEIVRDAASLGALEAKRVAREVAPRVARSVGFGLLGAVLGAAGFVLAVIAIFDLLAGAVPSTAGRLAILAAGFAVIAGVCAAMTVRGLRRVSEPGPHARVRETMPTGRRPPR